MWLLHTNFSNKILSSLVSKSKFHTDCLSCNTFCRVANCWQLTNCKCFSKKKSNIYIIIMDGHCAGNHRCRGLIGVFLLFFLMNPNHSNQYHLDSALFFHSSFGFDIPHQFLHLWNRHWCCWRIHVLWMSAPKSEWKVHIWRLYWVSI